MSPEVDVIVELVVFAVELLEQLATTGANRDKSNVARIHFFMSLLRPNVVQTVAAFNSTGT